MAYGTERLLILNTTGFSYIKDGFDEVFQPMSDTCTELSAGEIEEPISGNFSDPKVLKILETNELRLIEPRPKYLPAVIPADLAPKITKINGNPSAWWMGQLKNHILRMLPEVNINVQNRISNLGFKNPIVGVQIRRSDKVIEATTFSVENYMRHVEEYYDALELNEKIDKRRIFLASEDAQVIDEVVQKYPQYEVISDRAAAESDKDKRYSYKSLLGVLADIKMLSMCDYLVVTFSSNVGRMAYELMQSSSTDASQKVVTMDRLYYTVYQNLMKAKAFIGHHPMSSSDVSMDVEDLILVNHYSVSDYIPKGTNNRTKQWGMLAEFKLELLSEIQDFPLYKSVG